MCYYPEAGTPAKDMKFCDFDVVWNNDKQFPFGTLIAKVRDTGARVLFSIMVVWYL